MKEKSHQKKRLKLAYLGLGDIGKKCLKAIIKDFELSIFMVAETYIDDSILEFQKSLGLPFFAVANSSDVANVIKKYPVDVLVVAGCPFLLKKKVLDLPECGVINVHTAALPKYRGFHPLPWAIIHGEKEIGVTVHYVDEGMDSGDIILQELFPIGEEDTINSVKEKAVSVGARLVKKALAKIQSGAVQRTRQNLEESTFAPRRIPEDSKIDWSQKSRDIINLIRASEKPYEAFCFNQDNEKISIRSCQFPINNKRIFLRKGVVLDCQEGSYLVSTGDGSIWVNADQPLNFGEQLQAL